MPEPTDAADETVIQASVPPTVVRKRPAPGERRVQILQMLAAMLEAPGAERVTTSALAARLDVSEAALYRHFASKAQMFEGLIDFIEQSVFGLVQQVVSRSAEPGEQAQQLTFMLLQFAEKNPGMTRVMVGDALVFEDVRLQQRMNLFFDKFEAALRQSLRTAEVSTLAARGDAKLDISAQASLLVAFAVGRIHRFARSGFRKLPSERAQELVAHMLTSQPLRD